MPKSSLQPPAWSLAIVAMFSIQLGSALSLPLIEQVGPAGTAWLRLSFGALIFIAIARPPIKSIKKSDWPSLLSLGAATGIMTSAFLAAIERIPLGTTVAIEFLGPLSVAAFQSRSLKAAIWPLVAFVGVNLLTEPWKGEIDGLGILFAAISAAGWGAYIIFTQRVGDRFSGIKGLAITTPIAALTASLVGVPQAIGQITPQVMLIALGLALLIPVIPFALEMLALKRMKSGPFGTLMSIEPAIALLIGLVVLSQHPSGFQFFGIVLVVVAGVAASKSSERQHKPGH